MSAASSSSSHASVDTSKIIKLVESEWSSSIEHTLCTYISIPNASPMFDSEWETNGHTEKALQLVLDWLTEQQKRVKGLTFRVIREKGRTPLLFGEIASAGAAGSKASQETVLLYGHLDKQPPLHAGWNDGLGPYKPVIRDGKLYGRGGADDGYAVFAAVTSILALQQQSIPHARCVLVVEFCEESGSRDLEYHMTLLAKDIGIPSLCICLDSGCGNYDQLWLTNSLRGMTAGKLTVKIMKEGMHSGSASGIVPSTFRILRILLDRIENSSTGQLPQLCYVDIPADARENAQKVAATLGATFLQKFPFHGNARPIQDDVTELLLNSTWRPTLSVTGADGLPPLEQAGNVLRPHTSLMLSIRLPPTAEPAPISEFLKRELERDSPYGATVTYEPIKGGGQKGWSAPVLQPWLASALERASTAFFGDGRGVRLQSEGGSIPFMGMLGHRFPNTQFVVTGVLGPNSNAHGPNEFLHIQMFKNVTSCISVVLADHFHAKNQS